MQLNMVVIRIRLEHSVNQTSIQFSVQDDGLELRNEAEYASFVESKGYEVLTGAALYAEKRLKEEIK